MGLVGYVMGALFLIRIRVMGVILGRSPRRKYSYYILNPLGNLTEHGEDWLEQVDRLGQYPRGPQIAGPHAAL